MSILVEGMKKPNLCYEIIDGEIKRCPFVDAYDDCVILRKKGIWTGPMWADQYSKCPLVEVPEPHGRLIDADALADDLDYDAKHFGEDHEMKANYASWLRSDAIQTIIEADGE